MNEKDKNIIDLGAITKLLWQKRKVFFITWPIVFALSCLWILPEPRYYNCEVKLAPEGAEDEGYFASVASSFGLNLGGMATNDAIYPTLYPELFESPEFIAQLLKIPVVNDEGDIHTDYYTYLRKHQKRNWLKKPFQDAIKSLKKLFSPKKPSGGEEALNPFKMSEDDYMLVQQVQKKITCSVDKKTSVISISVQDQDRQICALMADSVRARLQDFITEYRTRKSRKDAAYYKHLTDSARLEYEKAFVAYGAYVDSHRNLSLQTYTEYGNKLKNEMDNALNTYNTFNAQLAASKAKVQERTPSFTTLKSATVPIKPAGPKRVIFVIGMLFLSSIGVSLYLIRNILLGR